MRKPSHIRVSAGFLTVCFLITSIISCSFGLFGLAKTSKASWVSKQAESPIQSTSPLFDEEIGEESEKNPVDGKDFKASFAGLSIALFEVETSPSAPDVSAHFFYFIPNTSFHQARRYLAFESLLI